jgi:quinol-cytochrome oxidoreductase complex cytochrome b subunit
MVTPTHIVPEWYFLPFYAILRSIPDKLGGVLALAGAILMLFLLPVLLKSDIRSMQFRPTSRVLFWIFLIVSLMLGWVGSMAAEQPFVFVGQTATFFYFGYFCAFGPLIIAFEHLFWDDAPVLPVERY